MNLEVAIRIIERDRWRIDSGGLEIFENWKPRKLVEEDACLSVNHKQGKEA